MTRIGLLGLLDELKKLNPGLVVNCDSFESRMVEGSREVSYFFRGTISSENLILPEGYYFSKADEDRNKHVITDFTVQKVIDGEDFNRVIYTCDALLANYF